MSFTLEEYEHFETDKHGRTTTRVTVTIQELTNVSIESVSSHTMALQPSDVITETDDDLDSAYDEEDDFDDIEDHWFPSLLKMSLIEYLDDDDELMLSENDDVVSSSDAAEIEEKETTSAAKTPFYQDNDHDDEVRKVPVHVLYILDDS